MKTIIKITAVALASIALAGCEQSPETDSDLGTEQSEDPTGMMGGDAGQADTVGNGTGQDLNNVAPGMDQYSENQTGQMDDEPLQSDEMPEQQPDMVRDAPQ